MSTAKLADLRTRDSIEARYRWRLEDIYADAAAWESDYARLETLIARAGEFAGKLAESAGKLYDCLQVRSEMSIISSKLYQYAALNKDLDQRNSSFQALTDRAAMIATRAAAAFAFIEPELLLLTDDRLRELAAGFPRTDEYDFYVEELIRSRRHIRSGEVEELLSLAQMTAQGPETIFTRLDNADLTFGKVKDEEGREIQLTKERFNKLLESSDQRVRRDASNALYSVYKQHVNGIGAMLSTEVHKNLFFTTARRYGSALHRSLDSDNIPLDVYMALLEATEANLAGLHRWVALRKKILKLDEIHPYDMICPLFPDENYEVTYDEAVTAVKACAEPLGSDYARQLAHAFDNRWVDVFETEAKASGAYSWGSFSAHPYVLMNFNDSVDNMFTLAHEMGHAMHSHFSNSTQPFPKAQYSIFVAEVASTLNEALLMQRLLRDADTTGKKLYLLNRHLDNTLGTFFHQVLYARFELELHRQVESGQALSPDWMTEKWGELTQKYYGPALTLDELSKFKWARIPHFYMTFYVYQYATSYAASQAIMDKFLAGERGLIERYLNLLKAGGRNYPIELLKACGVDMSTPAPVEATIKLFSDQVAQVEKLVE